MEELQNKFLEEANDLIQNLEDALLELDKNPEDKNIIDEIFRIMHSLKGNSAMFGYEKISEFTNNLENVYDMVKNGKVSVDRELLDITFSAADHIKLLLDKSNEENEDVQNQHTALNSRILKRIENATGSAGSDTDNASPESETSASADDSEDNVKTYHVAFEPNEAILQNGTNPLYLMDELKQIGDIKVIAHIENIPGIKEINPKNCYTAWDIFVATSQGSNAIEDVFIFVEDESTLVIKEMSEGNVLETQAFLEKFEELKLESGLISDNKLKELTDSLAKASEKASDTEAPAKSVKKESKETAISSIRVSSEKIDELMNMVSELVTTQANLSLISQNTESSDLEQVSEKVENLTRQLRDIAFNISLIPIDSMATRFQRLVRDLSNEFQKDINFETQGTEIELDKTLIQGLTEPLMHLLRNSIDHGIESKEERRRKNKPEKGQIKLNAYYSGKNVHIQIIDDGKGIDPQDIKDKAVRKELVSPDEEFSDRELYNMIFMSGLSTAKKITGVSGRGVGMDVVKEKINEVRGDVEVESEIDKGTTITIKLPLTLSIIDGLLVSLEDTHYVIPLSAVEKIYDVKKQQLDNAFNNFIVLDNTQVPFYYLREEFEVQSEPPESQHLIVVKYDDNKIGLTFDQVIGEYQAVIKSLGKHYKNQEIISGATIMGDGTVALVMDTNKIIKEFS